MDSLESALNDPCRGLDPKTALNQFCQQFTKRIIGKSDIAYTCTKVGDVFQAIVKLNCMDGIEFAGEPARDQKMAEKNSAKQAMLSYADEAAKLANEPKSKNNKRKATNQDPLAAMLGEAGMGDEVTAAIGNPALQNAKMQLNQALMKILARVLTKDDIVYSSVSTALGFQATIQMPGLPGEWASLAWAGEVSSKKKDAEENAARQAMEAMMADPEMAEKINAPRAPKYGKGKSKGTEFGPSFASEGKWGGKGKKGVLDLRQGWGGGGKGWGMKGGKGKAGGGGWTPPGPRERVSTEPQTGTIIDWKGGYGWVAATMPIEHEQASKNGGKIFLCKKDWTGLEDPVVGGTISFEVYADGSGLGAEEVVAL